MVLFVAEEHPKHKNVFYLAAADRSASDTSTYGGCCCEVYVSTGCEVRGRTDRRHSTGSRLGHANVTESHSSGGGRSSQSKTFCVDPSNYNSGAMLTRVWLFPACEPPMDLPARAISHPAETNTLPHRKGMTPRIHNQKGSANTTHKVLSRSRRRCFIARPGKGSLRSDHSII